MNPQLTILAAVVSVFAVVGLGVAVRRAGWLSQQTDESLLKLTIRVLMPCLIFDSVSANPALRQASNLVVPPLVGYTSLVIGVVVGLAVARLPAAATGLGDGRQRRTFALGIGLLNFAYVPIPLVKRLFDPDTLGVLFLHNVGMSMAMWTVGVSLLGGRFTRRTLLRMINPPSVAIVVALLFNGFELGHYLPAFASSVLNETVGWLAEAAIPVSLIVVGATMADQFRPKSHGQGPRDTVKIVAWSLALRLCLVPVAVLAMMTVIPASVELKRVMVVEAAMPTAVFTVVLARHYGGDAGTALRVVLATSIAALATIPAVISLGMRVLGV